MSTVSGTRLDSAHGAAYLFLDQAMHQQAEPRRAAFAAERQRSGLPAPALRLSIPAPNIPSEAERCIDMMLEAQRDGKTRKAMAFLYDQVDAWLDAENYSACDELLRKAPIPMLNTTLLVGLLSISRFGKAHLQARVAFVARVRAYLQAAVPERAEALMTGE